MWRCNSTALVIPSLYSGHYGQVVLLYRWTLRQASLYSENGSGVCIGCIIIEQFHKEINSYI